MAEQLQSSFEMMKKQISYDQLTSLYSREGLIEQVSSQETLPHSAVITCGVEQFRELNDSIGHDRANELLIEVKNRLQAILPENYLLARIGAADFTIYAPYISEESWVSDIVKRIKKSFKHAIVIDEESIFIKQVIGVALLTPDDSIEFGIRSASIAFNHAKKEPSNYMLYSSDMTEASVKRTQIVSQIKYGLENKEFVPYYQPLIDLKTNKIMGAEALARWISSERGLIPPDDFIPLAEEYGLINEIGYQILYQSCLDTKRLIDEGRWDEDFHIHVNVSVKQLLFAKFSHDLKEVLVKTHLPTKNLTLEITESNIVNSNPVMEENLKVIKELGISLSIDDFGTGYSSLAYLQDMQFDGLKIDRSFISRLEEDTADKSIVSAILAMMKNFDIPVVSEGIETEEQAKILARLGCEIAQGYFYSRPVPLEEWPYDLDE